MLGNTEMCGAIIFNYLLGVVFVAEAEDVGFTVRHVEPAVVPKFFPKASQGYDSGEVIG